MDKPEIKFRQCNSSNYRHGRTQDIQWIVLHYTANKGDTASGNASYFARTPNLSASANYFVDEDEIWQSVLCSDTAWHCGSETGRYYNTCRNSNSIGIEMCSDWKNGEYVITEETVQNAVKLTKWLMEQYGVDKNHVCMHWSVTRKECPKPWVDHPNQWTDFLKRLEEEDMTKAETTTIAQTEAKKIAENVYEKYNTVYESVEQIPAWGKDTITKLVNKGYLKGTGKGLDISEDLLRVLVINDRAGVYGE